MDLARKKAFKILNRIENDEYSNEVLAAELADASLNEKDRAFIKQIVFGVIENKIYIDYVIRLNTNLRLKKIDPDVLTILRLSVYQILFLTKVPDSAACNEAVILAKGTKNSNASGFINGVLRNIARNKDIKLPDEKDRKRYLSVKYSFPEHLIDIIDQYGKENTENILKSFFQKHNNYIRVNTLKTTADELIKTLESEGIKAQKTEFENALTIKLDRALNQIKAYNDGLFHLQDLSSQICCKALELDENERVYDVCAAPGGKSFTMAQIMNNTGEILACDISQEKINKMKLDIKRMGINNIKCMTNDAILPALKEDVLFDAILCDVPCSGLGIISKKPEIKYKKLEEIKELPLLQKKILANAAKKLKPNGRLVYSTCTLNKHENEEVILDFVNNNDEFEFADLSFLGSFESDMKKGYFTLLPGVFETDGFFISCIRKK